MPERDGHTEGHSTILLVMNSASHKTDEISFDQHDRRVYREVLPIDLENLCEEEMEKIQRLAQMGNDFLLRGPDPSGKNGTKKLIHRPTIEKFSSYSALHNFLKCRFYAMDRKAPVDAALSEYANETVPPVAPGLIAGELKRLKPSLSRMHFDLYIARSGEIPHTLTEIGRLREKTFREAGEGTGSSIDLDPYDRHYLQLVIYDREKMRIVGGYRLADGPRVYKKYGIEGFYIHTLFETDPLFHRIVSNAIELGRSYIVKEYQRQRLPLFLLWKGILHFLLSDRDIRYVYGPVSISKHYSDVSRTFIIEFLKRHYYDAVLAKMIKARKEYKPRHASIDYEAMLSGMGSEIRELNTLIGEVDPSFFGIPVLMRQYIRQNAKFIGFNLDPHFSDALDGFIILDLEDLPKDTIESFNIF